MQKSPSSARCQLGPERRTCPKANRQKDNQQQFSIITPRSKPSKSKRERERGGERRDREGEEAAKLHKDVCQREGDGKGRQRQWLSQAVKQAEMDTEREREREGRVKGVRGKTQVCISKKIIIIDAAKEAHPTQMCRGSERERERETRRLQTEDCRLAALAEWQSWQTAGTSQVSLTLLLLIPFGYFHVDVD